MNYNIKSYWTPLPLTPPIPQPTGSGVLQSFAAPAQVEDPPTTPTSIVPTNVYEKVLYTAYFRVSEYKTFFEKMDAFSSNGNKPFIATPEADVDVYSSLTPEFSFEWFGEVFDAFERSVYAPYSTVQINTANGIVGQYHYSLGINHILTAPIMEVSGISNMQIAFSATTRPYISTIRISKADWKFGSSNKLTNHKIHVDYCKRLNSLYESVKVKAETILNNLNPPLEWFNYDCDGWDVDHSNYLNHFKLAKECFSQSYQATNPLHDYPLEINYSLPSKGVISSFPWVVRQ